MSSLNNLYIKLDTLKTLVKVLEQKKENGISIDLSINDDVNDYGQNIKAYVSQSKEDREAKKDKFYVGNGKTFWTDGKITVATKKEPVHNAEPITGSVEDELSDLPF